MHAGSNKMIYLRPPSDFVCYQIFFSYLRTPTLFSFLALLPDGILAQKKILRVRFPCILLYIYYWQVMHNNFGGGGSYCHQQESNVFTCVTKCSLCLLPLRDMHFYLHDVITTQLHFNFGSASCNCTESVIRRTLNCL